MSERKENLSYPQKLIPPPEKMLKEFVRDEIGWDTLLGEIDRIEKDGETRGLLHLLANVSAIAPEEFEKARDTILTPERLEKFLNEIVDEREASQFDFALYDAACLKRIAPDVFKGILGEDFLTDRYQQLTAWLKAEEGYPEKYVFDLSNLKKANPTLFGLVVNPESEKWKQAWRKHAFTILGVPRQNWESAQLHVALNEIRPPGAPELCADPDIAAKFIDEIDELTEAGRYAETLQMIDDVRQIKIVATVKTPKTIH